MIHYFPKDVVWESDELFTNPFRYSPHRLVQEAAKHVMAHLDKLMNDGLLPEKVCQGFKDGKMLGVLIVGLDQAKHGSGVGYLAAFSGSVGGQSMIEGFVPPIFDLLEPDGYFKEKEREITDLNNRIDALLKSDVLHNIKQELSAAQQQRDEETGLMRAGMAIAKKERERLRLEGCDESLSTTLIRESQFEKAEFKRLKNNWEKRIYEIKQELSFHESEINRLKQLRASLSDTLQKWIFKQYRVHNALGDYSDIHDIFQNIGLTPPGGTGDCAAPKLLEYAYINGFKPLSMGEFWYGASPDTAVRNHGHFYPSCTSKCGPLLGYMLKGIDLQKEKPSNKEPVILYEDETIVAVSKPSGMPTVPGLNGHESLEEWLNDRSLTNVQAVHRLDMDTSGIVLFAKSEAAAVNLRKQFEEHTIRKTYIALLCNTLSVGKTGTIELPLSPDYDERPRQKVDFKNGKTAITKYKILDILSDGSTKIQFNPVTGRTHQLRVHSAHHSGLGCPIKGDCLYGSASASERLCLHALQITFSHPQSGTELTITDQLK